VGVANWHCKVHHVTSVRTTTIFMYLLTYKNKIMCILNLNFLDRLVKNFLSESRAQAHICVGVCVCVCVQTVVQPP